MAAALSFFSCWRVSVLFKSVMLMDCISSSTSWICTASLARRASPASKRVLTSWIESALRPRACSAMVTCWSHHPLWLVSDWASLKSLSTSSWISCFTFPKGSSLTWPAKWSSSALCKSPALVRSNAAASSRQSEGGATRPPRRCDWRCCCSLRSRSSWTSDGGCAETVAMLALVPLRLVPRLTVCSTPSRALCSWTRVGAAPDTASDVSRISRARVSATSSFSRAFVRLSQAMAFSLHFALSSVRYRWSSSNWAEVTVKSWLASAIV
mmetsp:Transcript_56005/g.163651  ORF Transcript_56005/g.163651 Transcript_56005/m.163651 type:complete len:268 (+) Transcript_56005:747-1550(+)